MAVRSPGVHGFLAGGAEVIEPDVRFVGMVASVGEGGDGREHRLGGRVRHAICGQASRKGAEAGRRAFLDSRWLAG